MKKANDQKKSQPQRGFVKLWAIIAIGVIAVGFVRGAQITVAVNGQQTTVQTEVEAIEAADQAGKVEFLLNDDQARIISQTGQPAVPSQVIQLLLPPHAKLDTIMPHLQATYIPVEGTWYVAPMPPMATWNEEGLEIIHWPTDRTIVDGYDIDLYGTNAFWPGQQAQLLNTGRLSSWKLAEVAVPLFQYNPVTGELLELATATVSVTSERDTSERFKASRQVNRRHNGDRVKKLALNYNQIAAAYDEADAETSDSTSLLEIAAAGQEAPASPTLTDTGYVIITTNAIRNASTKLAQFVAHKQASFTVTVITEDQYGGGTGDTAANNVRAWLKANYNNTAYGKGGILYVLLIGDPRTTSSSVPMKMCISDHPTDYYYAELTSNWDSDGDGIYGEEEDTTDKYFEVYVGRIPYYGTISETDSILQKIITYEISANTAWRRNVLLPMVPLDDSTPCYQIGEQIKYNLLEPKAIRSTRIYDETYGLLPPPEYLRENRYPATEWSQGAYGVVIWETHGWDQGASGIITTSDTSSLNNNYPSAVWQGSCSTGNPETTTNLGYSILKNGGIGTVAASRSGWYWVGESNFTNSSSQGGLGYQYAKRLAERKTLGQALWDTKEAMSYWLKNYLVHNLYGDPSVVIMPPVPDYIITPTHGVYFNTTYGGTSSDKTAYTLKNSGSAAMSWALDSDIDWITVSPLQGTINAGGSATVTVQLNNAVTAMATGTHCGTITISNTTLNTVEQRTVVLNVYPKSLRGYWKLDETTGTTASDAAGNGNGTLKGDNTFDIGTTAGQFGKALTFDGTDDYVEVPALNLYSNTVTISAWVKHNGAQTDWAGIVFSRANSSIAGISVRSTGELRYHWNNASSTSGWSTGLIVPTGKWVFVAVVVEPTKATMYMYDGTLYSKSQTVNHAIEEFNGITRIGHDPDGSRYFKGAIDDVRVYSEALSAARIHTLIQGGVAEGPTPPDGASDVLLVTDLKWAMGAAAAGNDVYFGTNYNDVLNADITSLQYKGRQTEAYYQPGTLKRYTDYYWRIDQVDAAGNVTRGTVWHFSTGNGRGGLTRQVWTNISGDYVTNLTVNARYPNNPDITGIITSFNCPKDWADAYGTRVRGFLIPPTTGNYTFWIASDDYSELWLSTDKNPANAVKIAYINGYTDWQVWTKYASQKSATKTLTAGQPYYIMALHKEGGGGDHLSVAWSGPGIAQQIIPGDCLMPYASDYDWGPVFAASSMAGLDAVEGYMYQGSIAGSAAAFNGGAVTYSKAAGPLWLTVAPDGTLSGIPGDGDTGDYTFAVRATDTQGAFSDALYAITVKNTFTGEMGLSDFAALAARWLDNGCTDYPPCSGADLTGDGAVDRADILSLSGMWLVERPYGGLVSRWTFDTDATDAASSHHGTLNGGAEIDVTDAVYALGGGALSLDGIDDYVVISGYKGVTGTHSRTCTAWIKTSTVSGEILTWGDLSSGGKWIVRVNETGGLRAEVAGGYIYGTTPINDGHWHHVAVVLEDDGSPDISKARLYVDGQQDMIAGVSGKAVNTSVSQDVWIGAFYAGPRFFQGLIDDVRIYDRALSAPEVEELALVHLQLHLTFDQTGGSIASDLTPKNRQGQLINGPVWQADSGAVGGALSFDGIDDYVQIPGFKGLAGVSSRTCAAWIKTTQKSGEIVTWGELETGGKWIIRVNETDSLRTEVQGGYIYGTTSINDGNWHHIVVVMEDDGSPDVSEIRLYVDGKQDTIAGVLPRAINTPAVEDVRIGVFSDMTRFFQGLIDDVRIYDCALKSSEILELTQ